MKPHLRHPVFFLTVVLGSAASFPAAEKKSDITLDWGHATLAPAIDEPVPAPSNLDPKYAPEALANVVRVACKTLGYRIRHLAVDSSEFPFIVHGVLADRCDHKALRDALPAFDSYAYVACAMNYRSGGDTLFALSITPANQYPRLYSQSIRQRLPARLRLLSSP